MPRLVAKTDANAKEIDAALAGIGCSLAKTDGSGKGFPDRVVGFEGVNVLLEYKDENKPPSKRKLNDYQKQWHGNWKGQVAVVMNPDEAVHVVRQCVLERNGSG